MTIRTMLIEDRPLMRKAIFGILAQHSDITAEAIAGTDEDSLETLRMAQPDVIVLSAQMPNPFAAIVRLKKACPEAKMLALVDHHRSHLIRFFVKAGIQACLFDTDEDTLDLETTIRAIAGDGIDHSYGAMKQYFNAPPEVNLTHRDLAIVLMVAQGYQNDFIAEQLGIGKSTVRNALSDIYDKLGLPKNDHTNIRVLATIEVRKLNLLRD